jgi:hypothetical protein
MDYTDVVPERGLDAARRMWRGPTGLTCAHRRLKGLASNPSRTAQLTAVAEVATDTPGRYAKQLVDHTGPPLTPRRVRRGLPWPTPSRSPRRRRRRAAPHGMAGGPGRGVRCSAGRRAGPRPRPRPHRRHPAQCRSDTVACCAHRGRFQPPATAPPRSRTPSPRRGPGGPPASRSGPAREPTCSSARYRPGPPSSVCGGTERPRQGHSTGWRGRAPARGRTPPSHSGRPPTTPSSPRVRPPGTPRPRRSTARQRAQRRPGKTVRCSPASGACRPAVPRPRASSVAPRSKP